MRARLRSLALSATLVLSLAAPCARAEALRLVASDDRGVTFRVELAGWRLVPDSLARRSRIEADGLEGYDEPGRPLLPAASTLIALPPGARADAVVIATGDEEVREGVALVPGGRPGWQRDEDGLGTQPTLEEVPAILDGPWPRSPLEVGEPFVVRRQRMVAVRVSPFRYDEASGRLWARRSITVRVTFTGGRAATALGAPLLEDVRPDGTLDGALLNAEQGRRFRMGRTPARSASFAAAPAAGAFGFDEDQPEVRVKVDSTSVFALNYDDLFLQGFPADVPIADVSVHRHEFVENTTPPYVTIELPCEVKDGNGNGKFDSGDLIYVYAQSWGKRARPSIWQRMWGDADYVYVTRLTTRAGLRVGPSPGWRGAAGLTPLASYPQTLHYEQDSADYRDYFAFVPDTTVDPFHWVTVLAYYNRPDAYAITASDLDTTQRVLIEGQFIGRRPLGRYVSVAVRNGLGVRTTVGDSLGWTGKVAATLSGTVTGSALTEGANALAAWARNVDRPPDPSLNPGAVVALNYFEVTLWRAYRPIRGYLPCGSGGAADVYQVKASGFGSNAIEVWDVTDSTAATRLDIDPSRITVSAGLWSVEFQDSTGVGQPRQYVVFDSPRFAPPEAYSAVTRGRLTELATPHDYLLVVPAAWEGSVAPLAQARRAQGLDVRVATYESIKDEFNGGRPSAYAVKRFIKYAYANWGTRYVTLMGDAGGEDPQNKFGTSSHEWLPTMMIQSPIAVTFSGETALETVPSDAWYGWCVDPACTDPTRAPKLHDVFVGRLPVNGAAEAAAVAQKLAAYEVVAPDQTWRSEMTLLADDLYSGVGFGDLASTPTYCRHAYEAVFSTLNQRVRDIILTEAGLARSSAEVFDLQQYLAGEAVVVPSLGDTCRPDRGATQTHTRATVWPKLRTRLSAGKLWWNYQGHANEGVLTHENLYYTRGVGGDWTELANDGKPFLFSAFSCHANNFSRRWEYNPEEGPCIGEELVVVPSKGAIASWASTGYEIVPSSSPGASHINLELARALFSRVPPDTSIALRATGDPFAHPVLGDVIALALMKSYRQVSGNPYERDVGITYELLGDPATRISIATPQSFVTANDLAVVSGVGVKLHTPGDTVRVVADLISNQALVKLQVERQVAGVRDTLDPARYDISPAFPDTARGGLGGRRYRVTYRDTLTARSTIYTFRSTDRQNVASVFDVVLPFETRLRSSGSQVADGDKLPPAAVLTLDVASPAPVLDPANSFVVRVNGVAQTVTPTPAASDPSGREWVLSWPHDPFAVGDYVVELFLDGVSSGRHSFSVTVSGNELRISNALLFPNPLDDERGASFSFTLESGRPADVLVRVYTVSGRVVYRQFQPQMTPGYNRLVWDGRDAEGDKLANGIYFYHLEASNGSARATYEGRIVKLRKPIRHDIVVP